METRIQDEQNYEYVEDLPPIEDVGNSGGKNDMPDKEQKQAEKRKKQMAKKRFKDRRDGRYLRSIDALQKLTPYIMPNRNDALIAFTSTIEMTKADKYCREKVKSGKSYFTILHLILSAYVRTIAEHPDINRFVSGRRIYARRRIEVNMIVKKEMIAQGAETGIKVIFDPHDTVDQVYDRFNSVVREVVDNPNSATDMDKLNVLLLHMPRCLLRMAIASLRFLDFHGWIPRSALDVSPFHGSLIITSMGSLGIPPVYHHIYNFGNLPLFISYGIKQTIPTINKDGETVPKKIIELKIVLDERICGGYHFASAFKTLKKYLEHPELLDSPPEKVVDDIY